MYINMYKLCMSSAKISTYIYQKHEVFYSTNEVWKYEMRWFSKSANATS